MNSQRFENKTYIGSGGMATVYRAYDSVVGRDVALKEIAEELRQDEEIREMFLREARKMAKVQHRNVVQIYDVILDEDSATLVEEFMDGGSLAKLVGAATLSPDETLKMLQDVSYGLQAIHRAGLIHRDMKPDNILAANGEWKVGDFGVAMSGDEEVLPFLGSKYAAPEVLTAPDTISEQSDIYSMGVMAAELVLGSQRFEEVAREALDTSREGAKSALKETSATFWQRWVSSNVELPLLNEINPVVSVQFSEFVAKLMARNPADRPKDLAEVIATIKSLRESEAMRMGAPTARDPRVKRKGKEKKKQPLWFKITAGVFTTLLLAVATLLFLGAKNRSYDITVETEPPGATFTINGAEHAEATPSLVKLRMGDELYLTKEGDQPQEILMERGMQGLSEHEAGELILNAILDTRFRMDTSRKASEYLAAHWDGQQSMGIAVPTATWDDQLFRLTVDTPLYLSFRPKTNGAITLLHLGADNYATLVYPNPDGAALGVLAGKSVTVGDELDMTASEPLGSEWLLILLTEEPLLPPEIEGQGLVEDWARYYQFGPSNSPAEQLVKWLAETAPSPLAVDIVPLEIVSKDRP